MTRDRAAAIMMMLLGLAGIVAISGNAFDGGPQADAAFFPVLVSGLLVILGIALFIVSGGAGERLEISSLKPLAATLSGIIFFSLTVNRLGFAIAASGLIGAVYAAGTRFKLIEYVILTVSVVSLSYVLFAVFLMMPLRLGPTS